MKKGESGDFLTLTPSGPTTFLPEVESEDTKQRHPHALACPPSHGSVEDPPPSAPQQREALRGPAPRCCDAALPPHGKACCGHAGKDRKGQRQKKTNKKTDAGGNPFKRRLTVGFSGEWTPGLCVE